MLSFLVLTCAVTFVPICFSILDLESICRNGSTLSRVLWYAGKHTHPPTLGVSKRRSKTDSRRGYSASPSFASRTGFSPVDDGR
uniref:Putative secreted peptide n=1 Tax=Anopheles braziliensis TaxID=58242 RepID=A0A2M3ZWZ7_9DIPT